MQRDFFSLKVAPILEETESGGSDFRCAYVTSAGVELAGEINQDE